MYIDLSSQPLPKVYRRKGKDCYLDPIRKKLIFITPEETIRQQVISHLLKDLKVPMEMISEEEPLSHFEIDSNRRADIIIKCYTKEGVLIPIAVIECKAPGIGLSDKVAEQLLFYSEALGCDYAMMINDIECECYHYNYNEEKYDRIQELPHYVDILENKYIIQPTEPNPERPAFEDIEKLFKNNPAVYDWQISPQTNRSLACAAFNFMACIFESERKLPERQYKLFRLIEDYGVRMLSYGNASGGAFYGPYRSFLIERDGSTEFVSIGFSTYSTSAKPDVCRTAMCVAIDNEKESHHSLQLIIDDNVRYIGNKFTFYHHGRIAVGNKGSGKVSELREFVNARYPQIIWGNQFNLGTLVYDRNWELDDPEVINFVENLISYALVRDEYRAYVKSKKQ